MREILDGGPERTPSRRGVLLGGAAVLAAGAAAGVPWLRSRGAPAPSPPPTGPPPTSPPSPSPVTAVATGPAGPPRDAADRLADPGDVLAGGLPGLVIVRDDGSGPVEGGARSIVDRTARSGPWARVVRRRADGDFGTNSAVVSYPVPFERLPETVRIGSIEGHAGDRSLIWVLDGSYAGVHGDLPRDLLLGLAAATRADHGSPAVRAADLPAGLTVHRRTLYLPPVLNEVRYGSADVGEAFALGGGLTYVETIPYGGIEDKLLGRAVERAGTVHGSPAFASPGTGGNGQLFWQAAPGITGCVGYSGNSWSDSARDALLRLAGRTVLLSPGRWAALHPGTDHQSGTI